jgi:twitching motility protein PilU
MQIEKVLREMVDRGASDLFLSVGAGIYIRVDGKLQILDPRSITAEQMDRIIGELANEEQLACFKKNLDADFALDMQSVGRFRVSLFFQRASPALTIRQVREKIDSFEALNLPTEVLERLSMETRGLVLLSGTAGSGKSTTIAGMIEYMNTHASRHILTIEDPIEFIFKNRNCLINQRELGLDVKSYPIALKAVTLQSPDVIFIGTIRDAETMQAAITCAEMGVLILSTVHTVNAAQTVERIINFFPPYQHNEVRLQLSLLLKGVISLRLIPRIDSPGRIPATEVMVHTPTIASLIREGRIWEIPHYIDQGEIFGMHTFTQSLVGLVKEGKISQEDALKAADSRDELELALKEIKRL